MYDDPTILNAFYCVIKWYNQRINPKTDIVLNASSSVILLQNSKRLVTATQIGVSNVGQLVIPHIEMKMYKRNKI